MYGALITVIITYSFTKTAMTIKNTIDLDPLHVPDFAKVNYVAFDLLVRRDK